MILRILGASLVALGLGFVVEAAHAGETVLCPDGRIVAAAAAPGSGDPCRAAMRGQPASVPAAAVPLPVKRPERPAKVVLKGATVAEPAPREIGAMAEASDFRRVRIINAQPGTSRWYNHTR